MGKSKKNKKPTYNKYRRQVEIISKLCQHVEEYRSDLQRLYDKRHPCPPNSNPRGAGRKSFDVCMVFKLFLIKNFLNMTEEEMFYVIPVRLDLLEILGIPPYSKLPCSSSLWSYKEMFSESGLFEVFNSLYSDLLNNQS